MFHQVQYWMERKTNLETADESLYWPSSVSNADQNKHELRWWRITHAQIFTTLIISLLIKLNLHFI